MSTASPYADIFNVVRAKLRKQPDELPDQDETMVEDAGILVPLLLARIPGAGASYAALTGLKKQFFDGAAGRLLAARLRPVLIATANDGSGAVIEEEDGPSRTKYSGPNALTGRDKESLEDRWVREAEELIAELSKLSKPKTACRPASGSFVGLPGRRRKEEAASGYGAVEVRDLLLPPRSGYGNRRVR